jgi:hypothetical protein
MLDTNAGHHKGSRIWLQLWVSNQFIVDYPQGEISGSPNADCLNLSMIPNENYCSKKRQLRVERSSKSMLCTHQMTQSYGSKRKT